MSSNSNDWGNGRGIGLGPGISISTPSPKSPAQPVADLMKAGAAHFPTEAARLGDAVILKLARREDAASSAALAAHNARMALSLEDTVRKWMAWSAEETLAAYLEALLVDMRPSEESGL